MSKALKVIGVVAGAVALVAGTLATGGALGIIAATGISGIGSFAAIASVAGLVAGVAQLGARALEKPPPARGSLTQVRIDPDSPSPYVMGEGYFAGVLRHRAGYGATLDEVPNPHLWEVIAYSTGGPIEGPITPQFDFAAVSSWYSSFFAHDSQLGATPEASALVPPYGAAPGWGAGYKLSGQPAIGFNFKFDKDGKRYASGRPVMGAVAKWVKVYDPRKDSTFPGGSGGHRLGDESTYEYSENPALHAGTYCYGRYQNGKRVFGMGLPAEAIDFEAIAAWANDCEANNWTIFGAVFEPGDRWANLRDICIAGGGEPLPLHTGIGFHWDRPRVVLDTITEADAGTGEAQVTAMQSYRDRINRIVPEYTSEAHNWELVKAEPLIVTEYVTEDGEEISQTYPFNLVKRADQAGQLAAYKMVNAREFHPITLPCKPRMRAYRPGDCLHIDRPDLGLDIDAVVLTREINPETMEVTLTLIGETASKHAYALGETAVPPPTPALGQTAQERDELAARVERPAGYTSTLIRNVAIKNPRDDTDVVRSLLIASESGGVVTVSVAKIDVDYPGEDSDIVFDAATIDTLNDGTTPLAVDTQYYVYFDYDPTADDPPVYGVTTSAFTSQNSTTNPLRHTLGVVTTPASGSGGSTDGGTGGGGYGWDPNKEVP